MAAFIVLQEENTGEKNTWTIMDLRRALKDSLASYKIPLEMRTLPALPRNLMGKGISPISIHRLTKAVNKKVLIAMFQETRNK